MFSIIVRKVAKQKKSEDLTLSDVQQHYYAATTSLDFQLEWSVYEFVYSLIQYPHRGIDRIH